MPSNKVLLGTVFWIALLGAYVLIVQQLRKYDFYNDIIALANEPALAPYALAIYCLGIALAMLTPFSSSAFFLFAALEVLGPVKAYLGALIGGGIASVVSYWIGRSMTGLVERSRVGDKLHQAQDYLRHHPLGLRLALFLSRAVPNPLYDVWGYASGIMRIPFWTYLIPSALGGSIPLAVVCFVPGVVS